MEQLNRGDQIFSDQHVSSLEGKHFNARGQQNTFLSHKGGTIFCDAATGFIHLKHQMRFTGSETALEMLGFEREAEQAGVTIKGHNTDNGVCTSREILTKLQEHEIEWG